MYERRTPLEEAVRGILAELGRIQNHLLCVGAAALDLGAFTGFLYGFNEREFIYDIMDYIAGQRFHPDWTRVGGAMLDLPDENVFRKMVRNFIDVRMPKTIKDLEVLLNRNRIFIDRLANVGTISREDAVAWSLTGPLARASGVKRDLRKDEPYLCRRQTAGNDLCVFGCQLSNGPSRVCRLGELRALGQGAHN